MPPPNSTISKPPPPNGERHTLASETELRLEIPPDTTVILTLLSGSAEIFGSEISPLTNPNGTNATKLTKQSHVLTGHAKFAIFTWHGCVLDVDVEFGKSLDISYTSEETACNVVYVNTHAQLEAMRDEALGSYLDTTGNSSSGNGNGNTSGSGSGPRVLVVGPQDSGKTSVVKVLTAYAVKLGRNPMLVDLDVSQNMLSIPGTIAASSMTHDNITPQANASSSSIFPNTNSLVLWYGSTDLSKNPDLYKALLDKMGQCIDLRLATTTTYSSSNNNDANAAAAANDGNPQDTHSVDAKSSGIIVNGCGWIEDMGYELMLHAIQALNINVVLVMGHDRLYSMLTSHFNTMKEQQLKDESIDTSTTTTTTTTNLSTPKVIKIPRSGGIVSRDTNFRRTSRMFSMKQYFYGESIVPSTAYTNAATMASSTSIPSIVTSESISVPSSSLVKQYSPSLLELNFTDLTLYKLSNVSLSASMLPVSAKQTSEAVQLIPIHDISSSLKHSMLAVCHPGAVAEFENSGEASDLYLSGVSGFVVVEKIDMEKEIISLLSPCAGSLPSLTLLLGEITWME